MSLRQGLTAQEHWWDAARRLPFVESVDVVRSHAVFSSIKPKSCRVAPTEARF